MSGKPRVITIDGPASAGKTSVAEALAERLGYHVYDTGALYRAATLLALRAGLNTVTPADEATIVRQIRDARIVVAPPKDPQSEPTVTIDGTDVTPELRGPAVNGLVSPVSQLPGVRAALMDVQREAAAAGNVIMVGRDMGTVVVPDADLKLYLTADAAVRAARRTRQLADRGTPRPYDEVLREETERDRIDSARSIAPLKPAPDAVIIATDDLTIDEIIARALAEIEHRTASDANGDADGNNGAPAANGAGKPMADAPAPAPAERPRPPADPRPAAPILDRFARFHTTGLYRVAYWVTKKLLRVGLFPLASYTIRGARNTPPTGPLIVAANHLHNFDPIVVGNAVSRNIRYMAKKELWHSRFGGSVIEFFGSFPVDRGAPDRAALRFAEGVVKAGNVLGMFPEGTRSETGKIAHVLPGAAFVAVRTGAPILPVAVTGTESLPFDTKAAKKPHHRGRARIVVTVGTPFHLTPGPNGKTTVAAATDEIMRHIAALLPPEYRGIYAEMADAAREAETRPVGDVVARVGEENGRWQ